MNRQLRRFLFLCLIALLTATHQLAFARFGFNDIIRVVQPQVKQQADLASNYSNPGSFSFAIYFKHHL